jgi:hypothetical protein
LTPTGIYPKYYVEPRQLSAGADSAVSSEKDLFSVYYPGHSKPIEDLPLSDEEQKNADSTTLKGTWQMLALKANISKNKPPAPVSLRFSPS